MASSCRLHERQIQHKDNGSYLSGSRPEFTQLSLTLYVSGASWVTVFCLSPVWVPYKPMSLCAGPLQGCLDFQSTFISLEQMDRILSEFNFPLHGSGLPGLRNLLWYLDPSLLKGNLSRWDVSSSAPPVPLGLGSAYFVSLPILCVSMCLLLYYLSYKV